jgi:hypothetical protein
MANPDNRQGQSSVSPQSERLARGVIARGRSIDIPDLNAPKQIVGYTPEGKTMTKLATRSYGPGQEVELPAAEIDSLRQRGFLLDPDRTLPPLAEGPHFSETGHHASAA